MKNLNQKTILTQAAKDRIFKYIGYGALGVLLMVFVSFFYCAAQANEQRHIGRKMQITDNAEKASANAKCYEDLHDVRWMGNHVYYRAETGNYINVGEDDKNACDALKRQNKRISEGGTK
jgi:uncharacterized membrane protein YukC